MTDFLNEWDKAIELAAADGTQPASVSRVLSRRQSPWPVVVVEVARTKHPSFMAANPPKYDPERDA